MLSRFRVFIFLVFATCLLLGCKNKTAQIPVSDFFKTPQKSFFKISPDGKYISYLKPYKDKQNLFIESLADGKEHMAPSFSRCLCPRLLLDI